jgi:uncharacterized membrane protein required for colicin V production
MKKYSNYLASALLIMWAIMGSELCQEMVKMGLNITKNFIGFVIGLLFLMFPIFLLGYVMNDFKLKSE